MSVSPSVRHLCVDLTDVTLADEDTHSIPTDSVNGANEGNVAMQVSQGAYFGSNASGVADDQILSQCKLHAIKWPNSQPAQVDLNLIDF